MSEHKKITERTARLREQEAFKRGAAWERIKYDIDGEDKAALPIDVAKRRYPTPTGDSE